jgi:hypothetical protein
MEKNRIDQTYQDGKEFAIINHCAVESTSAAHNREIHRQQIMQALNDGKAMVLGSIENLSLEQYYNEIYGGDEQ